MITFKNWAEVESVFAEAFDVPPASRTEARQGGDGEAGSVEDEGLTREAGGAQATATLNPHSTKGLEA